MNVSIPDYELVGIAECLVFVADLCRSEATALNQALDRFMGVVGLYDVTDLRDEILECADYLARALGYPDSTMDPDLVRSGDRS